jgi:hypothetical protein
LAGQSRQAFAAVGLGLHRRQVGLFGFGGGSFTVAKLGAGGIKPGAGSGQLTEQLLLGSGHLGALSL